MGFRDLLSFNKALLAKQGWRLLQFPDSLTAQIRKAKYYPGSNFLEASLGSMPSFAWRSIFGARDQLHEGLIWRIGSGHRVRIWGDRWIPNPTTYTIQSPPKKLDPSATVRELIDSNTGWWKQSLLRELFTQKELLAINSIPISATTQQDTQIWRCTNTGSFIVKSAYHLAKELDTNRQLESSRKVGGNVLWRILWKLPFTNAEKNFMWRASHNLLPTRDNLLWRKVV